MTDHHDRYEQLAVSHVLGGLDASDAAAFRSHLLGCRGCRARVAELRGIAADLEVAEREERAKRPVRTEARPQEPHAVAERGSAGITVRHVTIATIVVILFASAMGFWNLHLRTTTTGYLAAVEAQGDVLEGLARGVAIEPELGDGVTGLVSTDGDQVWVTLAGISPLDDDERLTAWLLGGDDGPRRQVLGASGGLAGGAVAFGLETQGARELVITRGPGGDVEDGARVLSARIRVNG